MKESLQEIALKWFRQAEYDLRDADLALKWGSFNLSCFLSKQSAEKAMKALLFYHGYEVVRGHSVGALCELIVSREPDFSNLVSASKWLDKFIYQRDILMLYQIGLFLLKCMTGRM